MKKNDFPIHFSQSLRKTKPSFSSFFAWKRCHFWWILSAWFWVCIIKTWSELFSPQVNLFRLTFLGGCAQTFFLQTQEPKNQKEPKSFFRRVFQNENFNFFVKHSVRSVCLGLCEHEHSFFSVQLCMTDFEITGVFLSRFSGTFTREEGSRIKKKIQKLYFVVKLIMNLNTHTAVMLPPRSNYSAKKSQGSLVLGYPVSSGPSTTLHIPLDIFKGFILLLASALWLFPNLFKSQELNVRVVNTFRP